MRDIRRVIPHSKMVAIVVIILALLYYLPREELRHIYTYNSDCDSLQQESIHDFLIDHNPLFQARLIRVYDIKSNDSCGVKLVRGGRSVFIQVPDNMESLNDTLLHFFPPYPKWAKWLRKAKSNLNVRFRNLIGKPERYVDSLIFENDDRISAFNAFQPDAYFIEYAIKAFIIGDDSTRSLNEYEYFEYRHESRRERIILIIDSITEEQYIYYLDYYIDNAGDSHLTVSAKPSTH